MNSNLKLYFYPIKMIKILLFSIAILLIGIYCLKSDIVMVKIIGLLNIILGISTLIIGLKSLLNKNPQITIDENGIVDNRILKNIIPWHQIDKIELTIINNQKFLKLDVSENFEIENFKWLFIKTSKERLSRNPKNVLMNLDQLKINYENINRYLSNKREKFIEKNLDEQLTGVRNCLNKLLY